MPYVFSTTTNDTYYCEYSGGIEGGLKQVEHKVLIKGGTGVATKHLFTPMGIMTTVSDDDLEFLQRNKLFQEHVKNGFLIVRGDKAEPETVAADMTTRDGSSPLVPGDFEKDKGPVEEKSSSVIDRVRDKFIR